MLTDMGQAGTRAASENVAVENLDDALCELDELIKCWENRLTFDDRRLAERYLHGELHLGLNFRRRAGGHVANPIEFRAVFKRMEFARPEDQSGSGASDPTKTQGVESLGAPTPTHYRDDRLVFVEGVHIMNGHKGFVPTDVRLEPMNEPSRFLAGALYFSNTVGFKVLSGRGYGEAVAAFDLLPVVDYCRANSMVEGGSEVVDTIADGAADAWAEFISEAGAVNMVSRLGINLSDDEVRVCITEPSDSIFDLVEVMFGPFDLDLSAE